MAKITKDQLIEAIESMTVMELSDLSKALEEKFGVTASMPMMAAMPQSASDNNASNEEEKTSFDVTLTGFDASQKLSVIKALRTVTDLTLGDAKTVVEASEKTPKVIKESVPKEEAEKMKKTLTEAGAKIELK